MAREGSWGWSLSAAILLWLATLVNGLQVLMEGASAMNVIPGVAFAVSGLLFFVQALRERGRA